jgi:hypothetical protein
MTLRAAPGTPPSGANTTECIPPGTPEIVHAFAVVWHVNVREGTLPVVSVTVPSGARPPGVAP